MSTASRNEKRGADKGGDSDISGQRPAMQATEYAGLHSLGSEAFRVPLPPPLSEPPRFSPRVRLGLYVLGAAVGISAAAVGVALVLSSKPAPARDLRGSVAAEVDSTGSEAAPLEAVAAAAPEPVAAVEPPAKPAAEAPVAEAPAAAEPVAAPAPAEPSAAPAPTASAAVEEKSASTRSRTTGSSRSRRAKDTGGGLTPKLSREQVIGAMNRVQPAVMDCFHSAHGTAMASITVVGKTGRVTTAQVTGMSGTVGSCIARAVRGATFPRFTDETLTVRYPFAH